MDRPFLEVVDRPFLKGLEWSPIYQELKISITFFNQKDGRPYAKTQTLCLSHHTVKII